MDIVLDRDKILNLRIKSRKTGLTMIEYSKFIEMYYNALMNNPKYMRQEMKDIVSFLSGDMSKVPPRFLVLKNPHKDPRKHYVLLFKFLTSLPPYDESFKKIASILKNILDKRFKDIYIEKKTSDPKVTLTSKSMIFYV
jgi:hypothetical protein